MKLVKGKRTVFGVLGLPRTGTTLLNNILNSYDNGFCISEPHWANILNPGSVRVDGVNVDCSNNGRIYENINNIVDGEGYLIGGVKETFREHQMASSNFILNSPNVDVIIGIFREPVSGFNGWLRTNWKGYYVNHNNYIKSYRKLFDTLNTSNKKTVFLKYEKICEGSVGYLNSKLDEIGLELEPLDGIKKTNYIFGDPTANSGGIIKKPNVNNGNINQKIQKQICSELNDIYVCI